MLDIIIKNGSVISPDSNIQADIGIKDGKIVMMGKAADMPEAAKVIDAAGKYVIPGGIDTHTHFCLPFMGTATKDDFYDGTVAAAVGGTTTIVDFAIQGKGQLPLDSIKSRLDQAKVSVIDYGFHSVITDAFPEAIANIKDTIAFGVPSFKCFMVYRKDGLMADDAAILEAMKQCKLYGGIFGAHAENAALIEYNVEKAVQEGRHDPIWHALTKPPIVESEAINRALYLAKESGVAFYNFHMTCKEGVEMIADARSAGRPAYGETCTHYLVMTIDRLKGADGINYICSPALREQEHVDALWKAIGDGIVQTVASDEAGFDTKQKMINGGSFESVPNGMPGCEFRMAATFSEGVSKGKISVEKYVAVTSTNAAKIMGMYPRKGVIAVGSDADIVLIDPELERTVTMDDVLIDMDWSPFAGMKIKGWPVLTVANGKVVAKDWQFCGEKGAGSFIPRKLAADCNEKIQA